MENGLVMEYVRRNPSVSRTRLVSRHLLTIEETLRLTVTAKFQVMGVVKGLEYLHSLGVVHGDVTPVGTSFYLAQYGTVLTKVKAKHPRQRQRGCMSHRVHTLDCHTRQHVTWRRRT